MALDRLRTAARVIAVGIFLAIGAVCVYLGHKRASEKNVPAAAKAEAHGGESVTRVEDRSSQERRDAADPAVDPEEASEVRQDLAHASRRVHRVGPQFSTVLPPAPPAPIRQTAPGVFTNREPDPSDRPSR
jgi:hypothetical protein